jgi:hypothetical protein
MRDYSMAERIPAFSSAASTFWTCWASTRITPRSLMVPPALHIVNLGPREG